MILGVCGYSGAGKSTFCAEISRRYQWPVLSTGTIVRRRITERGLAPDPETIARVSDEIRRETDGYFLRVLKPEIAGARAVLVDCLREDNDLLTLRELSDRAVLVAITASEEIRAARLLGRGRPGDPTDGTGLRDLDARERRLGTERLLSAADHVLVNDGDLGLFALRASLLMEEILKKG